MKLIVILVVGAIVFLGAMMVYEMHKVEQERLRRQAEARRKRIEGTGP